MTPEHIHDVRDEDSLEILAILGAVYGEYAGCYLEMSEVPELVRPATSFAAMNGRMWVAREADGSMLGFVAVTPSQPAGSFELKKLYLRRDARGRGLGKRLIALAEGEARARSATRIHLWSDTRFLTAHAVYERAGYTRLPETRKLDDVSDSTEFHFEKSLSPA